MPGKYLSSEVYQLVYYNHQLGKSSSELSEMFGDSRRTIYNIINRAEKEGRLEKKGGRGRKSKVNARVERLMLRKVRQIPQISNRTLAKEIKDECGVVVSHETVRQVILKNKYTSRSARKKPLLSSINIKKRFNFACRLYTEPMDYWDDVIFCDETKMMLYYNDGPSRVWRKANTALDTCNIILTVRFGKISMMIWGCFSSRGVGNLAFIDNTMDAANLLCSAQKFNFVVNNKPIFKFYQDNDPKHKALRVRTWLLYNCGKVIDTPAQSPDLNPIENLWAYLKKKVAERHPRSKAALKNAIVEEWQNIPLNYDLKKLANSMQKRLKGVVDAKGHNKRP